MLDGINFSLTKGEFKRNYEPNKFATLRAVKETVLYEANHYLSLLHLKETWFLSCSYQGKFYPLVLIYVLIYFNHNVK